MLIILIYVAEYVIERIEDVDVDKGLVLIKWEGYPIEYKDALTWEKIDIVSVT